MSEKRTVELRELAFARSGDKGSNINIGVFAHDLAGYMTLQQHLTVERIEAHFVQLQCTAVLMYPMQNLLAFNIVLRGALPGGASHTLRLDNMAKTVASALLRMKLELSD